MTGLILKLAPGERVLINGAVIENGDRRTRIAIRTPNASILRLKEAIHPDAVSTPVERVCHLAQTILSRDADPQTGPGDLLRGIEELFLAVDDREVRAALRDAAADVTGGNVYRALRRLRGLLPREAQGFARIA